jgi:hypothetical protein
VHRSFEDDLVPVTKCLPAGEKHSPDIGKGSIGGEVPGIRISVALIPGADLAVSTGTREPRRPCTRALIYSSSLSRQIPISPRHMRALPMRTTSASSSASKEGSPGARAAATKALELDQTLADARAALGLEMSHYEFDFSAAKGGV